MRYMQELIARMVDVPLARMFILAAILFLLAGRVGADRGKKSNPETPAGSAPPFSASFSCSWDWRCILTKPMHCGTRCAKAWAKPSPCLRIFRPIIRQWRGESCHGDTGQRDGDGQAGTGEKTDNIKSSIKVVSGTYGKSCGAKAGNATDRVARACDGQISCEYRIDPATLENAAPDCARISLRSGNAALMKSFTPFPCWPAPREANRYGLLV